MGVEGVGLLGSEEVEVVVVLLLFDVWLGEGVKDPAFCWASWSRINFSVSINKEYTSFLVAGVG